MALGGSRAVWSRGSGRPWSAQGAERKQFGKQKILGCPLWAEVLIVTWLRANVDDAEWVSYGEFMGTRVGIGLLGWYGRRCRWVGTQESAESWFLCQTRGLDE